MYTIFIHNEKTIPCISKSKTYHVGNMKETMSPFLCWQKVTMIDLQRFIVVHWFFFLREKVVHSNTLGLIIWATGFFSKWFFFGEKLSILALLWAPPFEPLVLFQGDFSLGKSCPFRHYFGPHLLSHIDL